jgi:RimJ/RimL family protein N-acetyltransferase
MATQQPICSEGTTGDPVHLTESDHAAIVEHLSDRVAANLFQLCWLENHGVQPLKQREVFAFRGMRSAEAGLRAVSLVITRQLAMIEAATPDLARRFGRWYRHRGIEFEHIVSADDCVRPFWEGYRRGGDAVLEPRLNRGQTMYEYRRQAWGSTVDRPGETDRADTGVRLATEQDLEPLYLASARMHREETLEDPLRKDPGGFRSHVEHRVANNRSFVWFDRHRLIFKADISARGQRGVQISGVYTAPERRGQGLATRAMFDICDRLFEGGAPRIVLYVNDDNRPARRVYDKVGFEAAADYRTIFVDRSASE